ncbi:MAG: hypothetical protein IKF99_00275 [Oscillospiraceae bacterium]|nr:hypothetical protein [Oscillospiraceae bacterium]
MNPAKEYLSQIKTLDSKIRRKQQEAKELRDAALSLGSTQMDPDRIRSASPDPDPMASQVGRYVDIQKEVQAMIIELMELKHLIIGQIAELDDSDYMDVLWKRYVDLKTFSRIADEMGYDISTIFRIHGRALQAFNEKYNFVNLP